MQGRFYADPAVTVFIALGIMMGAGWGSWKCGKGMLGLLRGGDCGDKDEEYARRRDGSRLKTGKGELMKMNDLADEEELQGSAPTPPSPLPSTHLSQPIPFLPSGPPAPKPNHHHDL
jgi:hypothetical protein